MFCVSGGLSLLQAALRKRWRTPYFEGIPLLLENAKNQQTTKVASLDLTRGDHKYLKSLKLLLPIPISDRSWLQEASPSIRYGGGRRPRSQKNDKLRPARLPVFCVRKEK